MQIIFISLMCFDVLQRNDGLANIPDRYSDRCPDRYSDRLSGWSGDC